MKSSIFALTLLFGSFTLLADEPAPVIKDFGYFYDVPGKAPIAKDIQFKIAFDVAEGATVGEQNNHINSLARFINMHAANGVDPKNISLALVIHGGASFDVLKSEIYEARFDKSNKSQSLITQLLSNNTQIFVCGQSAMHHKVASKDLIPGVTMSLSAMTAHAQLQQKGYTLNPF
jgi:intracellular sulfur oxidation DsrE/DsrF family protein